MTDEKETLNLWHSDHITKSLMFARLVHQVNDKHPISDMVACST
jgi:hypothetical protein